MQKSKYNGILQRITAVNSFPNSGSRFPVPDFSLLRFPFQPFVRTRNTCWLGKPATRECSSIGRVFCSLLAKAVYHSPVIFFLSLFTADTNVGQSDRLTHSIKKLQIRDNLKSLIFKHALLEYYTSFEDRFLVCQSFRNAISLSFKDGAN